LHEYTLVLALRLGELPSTPLPLFNGGAPPPLGDKVSYIILPQRLQLQPTLNLHGRCGGYSPMLQPHATAPCWRYGRCKNAIPNPIPNPDQVESVQLYKNGGVGALNDMGTQEAAAH